ncbi:MAG TPA: mechanosensitive ion channel domain-containing protein [Beijerinckiaceae bacterium]|nr:mechanosensitive ion channel domain-containing protein [Beijerinckiaceae bacterium]
MGPYPLALAALGASAFGAAALAQTGGTVLGATAPGLAAVAALIAAILVALAAHALLFGFGRRLTDARLGPFAQALLSRIDGPARFGLVLVAVMSVVHTPLFHGPVFEWLEWLLLVALIAFIGWGAVVMLDTAADLYMRRVPDESDDPVLARKHITQVQLLRRIAVILIGFVTFSAVLMTVPAVRQYGVSLFASAGVAGLVVGLAARPLLSNLIAGIQIAVTQPIRLGDAVTIDNEFGSVEEIRTTYVVVRLWDGRRLVVPLSFFMEKNFQNWTLQGGSIVGSVMLFVDYTVPIGPMRERFLEVVRSSPLWDGKTAALQVFETTQAAVQLRGLVSARSPRESFELRCEVREKMVGWLQERRAAEAPPAA